MRLEREDYSRSQVSFRRQEGRDVDVAQMLYTDGGLMEQGKACIKSGSGIMEREGRVEW